MVKRLRFGPINCFLDPTLSTVKVTSPLNLVEEHARVCELINCDRGESKAQVVKFVFISHEAETIMDIPISSALPKDSVI